MSRDHLKMARTLTREELVILETLIAVTPQKESFLKKLQHSLVETMNDGGMGSVLFIDQTGTKHKMGSILVGGEFFDEDGVLVSVDINLDERGELFELDIWKVDFSPLKRYPKADEIIISEEMVRTIWANKDKKS